ncbi:hypothetical protein OG21DRAFT_1514572 [Imleria badia]|nr:hypothetical protein OG21DRAFT_1514572 [Imleria badia]
MRHASEGNWRKSPGGTFGVPAFSTTTTMSVACTHMQLVQIPQGLDDTCLAVPICVLLPEF